MPPRPLWIHCSLAQGAKRWRIFDTSKAVPRWPVLDAGMSDRRRGFSLALLIKYAKTPQTQQTNTVEKHLLQGQSRWCAVPGAGRSFSANLWCLRIYGYRCICIDVISPGRASSLGWALKARWCCVLAARLPSCGWAFWLKICLVWSLCAFCSYAQNSAVKFVWILLRLLAPLIPALCRRYRAIRPASLFGCPILWGWSPFLSIKD